MMLARIGPYYLPSARLLRATRRAAAPRNAITSGMAGESWAWWLRRCSRSAQSLLPRGLQSSRGLRGPACARFRWNPSSTSPQTEVLTPVYICDASVRPSSRRFSCHNSSIRYCMITL